MKKTVGIVALLAAAGMFSLGTVNAAEKNKDKGKGSDAGQNLTDEQFVQKASQDGLAEVNHGRMAAQRASSDDVKRFAQRMVEDHTKANAELLSLANRKQFTLARDMGREHQQMAEKLAQMKG